MALTKALKAAHAARAAKAKAGERIKRSSPLEKHERKPQSLRLAVNAKCYDCQGRDCDVGWRKRIRECNVTKCPLHSVRPYQDDDPDLDDSDDADTADDAEE